MHATSTQRQLKTGGGQDLPPYSPDFNPIEDMWSKIKQILRSQAPRTESEMLLATKTAFQAISAADCEGFFFSAKYAT